MENRIFGSIDEISNIDEFEFIEEQTNIEIEGYKVDIKHVYEYKQGKKTAYITAYMFDSLEGSINTYNKIFNTNNSSNLYEMRTWNTSYHVKSDYVVYKGIKLLHIQTNCGEKIIKQAIKECDAMLSDSVSIGK